MTDRELTIKFVGKDAGLERAALAGADAVDRLGEKALGAARKLEDAGGSTKGFSGAIAGLAAGASFAAIDLLTNALQSAGAAVLGFVSSTFQVGGAAQQADVAFTTMLGSAEKAQAVLSELSDFAATTPFDLPGVRAAGQQLLAFGFVPEALTENLTRLGDVAAGVNTDFGELATIYGKAKVAGRLYAEDVNQLTERGIPIIQEFAKQFGVAESQVKILVEQGKIGFPELEKAFIGMTSEGGKFGGLMAAQAKTIPGQVSNIQDSFIRLQEAIFKALGPATAAVLTTFQATLNETGKNFDGFGPLAAAGERLNKVLSENPEIAKRLGEALGTLANEGVEQLASLIEAAAGFAENQENIDGLAEAIEGVAISINFAAAGAGKLLELRDAITGLIDKAGDIPIVGQALNLVLAPLLAVQGFPGAVQGLGELRDRAERLKDNLLGVRNEFEGLGASTGKALAGAGANVSAALDTALKNVQKTSQNQKPKEPEKPKPPDLSAIEDKYKGLTATIDIEESKQIAALVRSGATQEKIAAEEQKFLQKRIDLNQQKANELRAVNANALDEKGQAKLRDDLLKLDQDLASDRLKIAEAAAAAREAAEKKALEAIEEAAEKANNVATEGEQQRQIELAKLRRDGVIGEEEYQEQLTNAGRDRIKAELAAEQAKFAALKNAAGADEDDKTASRQRINSLTLELIESEIEAEEEATKTIEAELEKRKEAIEAQAQAAENSAQAEVLSLEQVATALEAINGAYDRQAQLLSARTNLLNTLGSALSDSFNNGVTLLNQDIANAKKEKDRTRLTKERDNLEKQAATARRASLERSQALELLTFDLRQKQLQIENQIEQARIRGAIAENQAAQARAQANIATLQAEGASAEQVQAAQLDLQASRQSGEALAQQFAATIQQSGLIQELGGIERQGIQASQRSALTTFDTQELDRRFQALDDREANARSGRERREIEREREQLQGQNNRLQRQTQQDIQFFGGGEASAFQDAVSGLNQFADRMNGVPMLNGGGGAPTGPLGGGRTVVPTGLDDAGAQRFLDGAKQNLEASQRNAEGVFAGIKAMYEEAGIQFGDRPVDPAQRAQDRASIEQEIASRVQQATGQMGGAAGGTNITNDVTINITGADTADGGLAQNVEDQVFAGLSRVISRTQSLLG
ncbi:tape measure protein [Nodosilinea sp. FACHB-131]|uniref:tape measure protein n=1 Tax=Cyanophyceae TaxID=3028117 RepID=UPI001686181E|nr:tape measure protein [Nodosilinea sp. FACHB-131]MBD1871937.1 tape measure protein [Nodosilinea sp. FACHB-131]